MILIGRVFIAWYRNKEWIFIYDFITELLCKISSLHDMIDVSQASSKKKKIIDLIGFIISLTILINLILHYIKK